MIRSGTAAICLIFLFGSSATSAATADPLRNGFADPPDAARPRVWWHWLNGNITKEGITLDLEWMKRVGIGGAESFQGFLGPMGPGKVVEKQLPYMSDGWQDAMHHAAVTADRLGLELGIAASPGWSETGGPWVPLAHGMKKFVWSETYVDGGHQFHGTLPKPPDATGPYQSLTIAGFQSGSVNPAIRNGKFYLDSAVVAYRAPEGDVPPDGMNAIVTASAGQIDGAALADGTLAKPQSLPMARPGESAWIRFDYPEPFTV